MCSMNDTRLSKKIFWWTHAYALRRKRNWIHRLLAYYETLGLDHLKIVNPYFTCNIISEVKDAVKNKDELAWRDELLRIKAKRGRGLNKLRTYRTFKSLYGTELYVKRCLSRGQRSALAQFRCGTAPIRLETGRFENLPVEDRTCPLCQNGVESETHVLLYCPIYTDIRSEYFNTCRQYMDGFTDMNDVQKTAFILSNENVVIYSAKACQKILNLRRNLLYDS